MATKDSENRFQKIMDKLYYAPRSRLSPLRPRGGDVIASERLVARSLALRGPVEKSAPCRPWDRGDLIRRLTTFKAMTWFGKPKVISPLNCARRGWINVEMDVIVCEACGARLFFSTPPSWAIQQVEKAAAVFSLKLDNGHKLLCPWIDNACDESLSYFPSSPSHVLVEGFRERFHALLRLTALPVISSTFIDCMSSHRLDHFLSAPFCSSITLSSGIRLIDDCRSKDQLDTTEDGDSHGYYQALKIISLCGWEPRLLPYTVEFEGKCGPSANAINPLESSEEIPCEPTQNITKSSSNSHNDVPHGEYLYDQSSTVLDCRFCGACVGLWFFKTVPRPLEFFRIIIDGSPQSESTTGTTDFGRGDHNADKEKPFCLNLTIAGGPPPTKQHFHPKISFPAVSRHMRAELSYNTCLRLNQGSSGKEDNAGQEEEFNGHHEAGSLAVGSLKRKRSETENLNSQIYLEGNHGDEGDGLAGEVGSEHTSEETLYNTPFTDARESNDLVSVSRSEESNFGDRPENDHCYPLVPASSVANVDSSTCSKAGEEGPCFPTADGTSLDKQDSIGSARKVSISVARDDGLDHLFEYRKQTQLMDFDPIKQHRPFCPWFSYEGKNLPGWKATLSALDDLEKNSSQPPEQTEAPSSFLDEADDPVVSVRKLFASPPFKRFKESR
ncbi:uncharacterized protein LOC110018814 [Phalaenopsis equestris]|uniref:uncharacterized protein LOC110018814 n=1 Tax=Phalaenopsis equestris TaxID=78828 RepID=UPI0009E2656F|nr:uncharacterized protein LOC110018814 [Phalaenopsis equestris]